MRINEAKPVRRFLKGLLILALLCAGAAYVYANVEFVDTASGHQAVQESKSGC